ncbi:MAG: NUDIX hydrolase [Chloroflexota bacterium]
MQLLQAVEQHELNALHQQWGNAPHEHHHLIVDHPFLTGEHEQLTSGTRRAEICYIMHRGDPADGVLLHLKSIYPENGYRLPTGGIHEGEGVYDTLLREVYEETGQVVGDEPHHAQIQHYLGAISYDMHHGSTDTMHTYATYCFLVQISADAKIEVQDPDELICGWEWCQLAQLSVVAETLRTMGTTSPDWGDWGIYRAIVHEFVARTIQVTPVHDAE